MLPPDKYLPRIAPLDAMAINFALLLPAAGPPATAALVAAVVRQGMTTVMTTVTTAVGGLWRRQMLSFVIAVNQALLVQL